MPGFHQLEQDELQGGGALYFEERGHSIERDSRDERLRARSSVTGTMGTSSYWIRTDIPASSPHGGL